MSGVIKCKTETLVGKIRDRAKMSQRELAEAIGINQPLICGWESHKVAPSMKRMKQLIELAKKHKIRICIASLKKEYGVE